MISVEARKHHSNRNKPHKHLKDKGSNGHNAPDPATNIPGPAPAPLPYYGSYPTHSIIFDVLSFGAKGDGVSDDSKVRNSQKELWKNMFLLAQIPPYVSAFSLDLATDGASIY